jgi:hypothetical protein
MEARTPASGAVAEAIRAAMKSQSLSGSDLADRLARIRGQRPGDMWISKRRHGAVHLVTPKVIEWEATDELREIAQALGVPVEDLVRAANARTASNTPADN